MSVVITDVLPISTTYQSCSPAPCGLNAGNVISWSVGTLGVREVAAVTLLARVNSDVVSGTFITNAYYGVISAELIGANGTPVDTPNVTVTSNYTLTVNAAGTGSGTVSLNPNQASYTPGTVVTLTAVPSATSIFAGWSGAVTGLTPSRDRDEGCR